jgi:hypothetical protein
MNTNEHEDQGRSGQTVAESGRIFPGKQEVAGCNGGGLVWTSWNEPLAGRNGIRFGVGVDSTPVAYAEVLNRWQNDPEFRGFFNGLLAGSGFSAFRWETPSIAASTVGRPFEFVLFDSPGLAKNVDARAFAEHFRHTLENGVVEFPNLGGDAVMVVPCPLGLHAAYGHIGAFVRQAPEPQRHALWKLVGAAMQRRLSTRPVWLSTAGAGVSWLHVRLDDRPKYYGYEPYREGL